jgi:hypothetical protein
VLDHTYNDLSSVRVGSRARGSKLINRIEYSREVVLGVNTLTAPHLAQWKGAKLEIGNDTKVVAAAAQRPIHVRESCWTGHNHEPRSSDDFVAGYVVTSPTEFVREEGDSSSKNKTRNAHRCHL